MTRDDVQRWLDAYVEAWRSYEPGAIGALFAADAEYRYQPYLEPVVGRDAIVADWLQEPDPSESWSAHYAPFAVEGDHAVAVGESRYLQPDGSFRTLFYNVWLLRFDDDGRCTEFVEYWRELPESRRPAMS
ncbi:MAG TPA: nuclear transport factor 2 family protein [Candidatus Limnocylindrales bacterium]